MACSSTSNVTVAATGGPSIDNVNTTPASCSAADGTITITAMGNNTPFEYSIDGGITYQAANTFDNLAAGTYNVLVQDATGCTTSSTAVVSNSALLVISGINTVDPSCGQVNGSISILASGGVAPLQYSIDGGVTYSATSIFDNLGAGTYDIVVIDDDACQTTSPSYPLLTQQHQALPTPIPMILPVVWTMA